jgi:signal recognition particle subunit SRP72
MSAPAAEVDPAAFALRATQLLLQENYSGALQLLETQPVLALLPQAYALYRSARPEEALALLEGDAEWQTTAGARQLRAQLLCRAGRVDEALSVYEEALAAGQLESEEACTNLLAVHVTAGRASDVPQLLERLSLTPADSFTASLNAACASLALGRLEEAEALLASAHRLGEEEEEDMTDVLVQQSFVAWSRGRLRDAASLCSRVLRAKPTDASAAAVAACNLAAARGSHSLLDSLKRLDKLLDRSGCGGFAAELEGRLSPEQKAAICFNRASLLLAAHKLDALEAQLTQLQASHPSDPRLALLHASLLLARDKEPGRAAQALASAAQPAASDARLLLLRAQLALRCGDLAEASQLLSLLSPPLSHAPRLVATRVALLEALGQASAAGELLDGAAQDSGSAELRHAAAELRASHGRTAEAVLLYRGLLSSAEGDTAARSRALRGLISALAAEDLDAAESAALPLEVSLAGAAVDAEELDSSPALLARAEPSAAAEEAAAKPRKRRVRKPLYPAGFDPTAPNNPPPDPERWLPRRERSSYKIKKGSKKAALRGSQGSAAVSASAVLSPPPQAVKKKGRK